LPPQLQQPEEPILAAALRNGSSSAFFVLRI